MSAQAPRRTRMVLPWAKLLNAVDMKVLHQIAIAHHRGSFLRIPALDQRRYMPSDVDMEEFKGNDLHFSRGGDLIALDAPHLRQKISRGRSLGFFKDNGAHDFATVSSVLNESFGAETEDGLRPYPSGGRLYPVDVFLVIFTDGDFKAGIYHYLANLAALEWIAAPRNCLDIICGQDSPWGKPAFAIVYMANGPRMAVKYRFRGYRLALMEVGAMFQQAALVAANHALANRVVNSFSDHQLLKKFGLNPSLFLPLAVQLFGTHDAI